MLKWMKPLLWIEQAFFKEDVDSRNYHELCICFLMDVSESGLLAKGDIFYLAEFFTVHIEFE